MVWAHHENEWNASVPPNAPLLKKRRKCGRLLKTWAEDVRGNIATRDFTEDDCIDRYC